MNDTIAALATPLGKSGIAVIRISGPEAFKLTASFLPGLPTDLKPRRAYTTRALDRDTTEEIDRVVVVFFKSPSSYTGEDVVEISTHGSPAVIESMLDCIQRSGARMAAPGEFTKRAFLNGKIDLTQAEAVAQLIASESQKERRAAQQLMAGGLSKPLEKIRKLVLETLSEIELGLDFPEEENPITPESILSKLMLIADEIAELIQCSERGQSQLDCRKITIAGNVNSGKSTLFNRLAGAERAIVTSEPGTTRDLIETHLESFDVRIILTDTAGLRESTSEAEKIGISKAWQSVESAELVLVIIDALTPDLATLESILQRVDSGRVIGVWNKIDLAGNPSEDTKQAISLLLSEDDFIPISAKIGTNIHQLKERIAKKIKKIDGMEGKAMMLSMRQRRLLPAVHKEINLALDMIRQPSADELAAAYLRSGYAIMGEILGDNAPVEVLEHIFSSFCIGK